MAWQNAMLPGVLKSERADVYLSLSHYLPATIPGSVKTVIGVSNLAPFSEDAYDAEVSWRKKLRLRMLRRTIVHAARKADRVVALSDACKQELVERGVSPGKIAVISNGAPDVHPAGGAPLPLAVADGPFILCVSHFYRYKNYERLIQAFAQLGGSLKADHKLVLVGKPYDASYVAGLEQLARTLNVADRVVIIPGAYGNDLAALYQACRLFVFPSLVENSPITLLEAMARQLPIAAADIPSVREHAQDSIRYFDPHSVASMASVMTGMLADASLCQQLGAMARQRATLYRWDDFSRKLVDVYRNLI